MYRLYIGNKNYSSWSLRPWVLLGELQIPFSEELVPFDDGGSWEKFRAFSPTGLVPCLVDGETTVWESLAIAEYLAERHDGVWPRDERARSWARSAASEMHAGFGALRNECPMTVGLRIRMHEVSNGLRKELARLGELWQQGLDVYGGPFLAGEAFSAVDAFFAPVAFRVQTYSLSIPPPCQAYAERLINLPNMQAWTQAAIQEPWREPTHEEEFAAIGEILEDRRTS